MDLVDHRGYIDCMDSKIATIPDCQGAGKSTQEPNIDQGEKQWSEHVRNILLAQPLNPISVAVFHPLEPASR